jgi:hypothetical protein
MAAEESSEAKSLNQVDSNKDEDEYDKDTECGFWMFKGKWLQA